MSMNPAIIPETNRTGVARGFTLVEVLVVITIVGILTAIAVPSFNQYRARKQVQVVTSDLVSSIRLTRSEALQRNRVVTMCRTTTPEAARPACTAGAGNWNTGWVIFEDAPPFGTLNANDTIIRIHQGNATGADIQNNNAAIASFTGMGSPNLAAGAINTTFLIRPKIANPDTSPLRQDVIINTAGRVRIQKY